MTPITQSNVKNQLSVKKTKKDPIVQSVNTNQSLLRRSNSAKYGPRLLFTGQCWSWLVKGSLLFAPATRMEEEPSITSIEFEPVDDKFEDTVDVGVSSSSNSIFSIFL